MKFFSIGTLLLILIFPLGQLTRIEITPSIVIYWHDFLLLLLVLSQAGSLLTIIINNKRLQGFLVFSILSLLLVLGRLPFSEVIISGLYLGRWSLYVVYLLLLLKAKPLEIPNVGRYLTISIAVSLILGYLQYLFIPSFEFLYPLGWDRHNFRLTGTWLDVNFSGLIFVLFFIWLLQQAFSLTKNRLLILFLLIADFLALLLTYSRSSYLAFMVGMGVFFIMKHKIKYVLWLSILLIVILPFLPKRFGEGTKLLRLSTINARLGNWQNGMALFSTQPILGYGFDTLRYIKRDTGLLTAKWQVTHSGAGLDNSLLFILATTGIVGAIQFLLFWQQLLRPYFANPVVMASLAALFVHGMFVNSWFYAWILLWLFFMFWEQKNTKNAIVK